MKQGWSGSWVSSRQPRKQRKFRFRAPLHVRHKFLSAHLDKLLRKEVGRRSLPLRKGDEVLVMKGSSRGFRGVIDSIDLKKARIYVDGIKARKVDGSEVLKPLSPSNVLITKLNLDDKWRKKIIERKRAAKEGAAEKKPEKKLKGKPPKKPKGEGK
jgi:large subunit ribosomal protein L24